MIGVNACLVLCRPMDYHIKFDTFKAGWPTRLKEGSKDIISK